MFPMEPPDQIQNTLKLDICTPGSTITFSGAIWPAMCEEKTQCRTPTSTINTPNQAICQARTSDW
jgi:hypothetical protein